MNQISDHRECEGIFFRLLRNMLIPYSFDENILSVDIHLSIFFAKISNFYATYLRRSEKTYFF